MGNKANRRVKAALLKDIKERANETRIYAVLAKLRKNKDRRMEDTLDPEPGAWSLCDHCINAWHEEHMDSTPHAGPRSVLRGR